MTTRASVKLPVPSRQSPTELQARFAELQARAGAAALAVSIADLETDRAAKVSTRVPDEQEWHVASWNADLTLELSAR